MAQPDVEYDVVVVGGGVMGSAAAYEIARRGQRTLLLEQFEFLHRRGSSHGESRIIRKTYPQDFYVKMMVEAYHLWEAAQHEAGERVHTETGVLAIASEGNGDLKALIDSCTRNRVSCDVLSPEDLRNRFPALDIAPGRVAIYSPEGGVLDATRSVAMFQRLALKHGAVLRDRLKVTGFTRRTEQSEGRTGVRVETSEGSVSANRCILTVGAWSSSLLRSVSGIDLPIQPLLTKVAYWRCKEEHAEELSADAGFPVFLDFDNLIYGFPCLELPGLVKVCIHGGPPCDPDTRDAEPSQEAASEAEPQGPFMRHLFGGRVESDSPVKTESCLYSMTPDDDFIIDFLPQSRSGGDRLDEDDKRLIVAGGFSGHGFKFAPLIGKILADLAIHGESSSLPANRFMTRRFTHSEGSN